MCTCTSCRNVSVRKGVEAGVDVFKVHVQVGNFDPGEALLQPVWGPLAEVGRPRVHLDTTMAFTDFFESMAPYPVELRPRLADLGGKVLLGTDFPNIPYEYAHQLEALARLDLGDEWLRGVCWSNAVRLFSRGNS